MSESSSIVIDGPGEYLTSSGDTVSLFRHEFGALGKHYLGQFIKTALSDEDKDPHGVKWAITEQKQFWWHERGGFRSSSMDPGFIGYIGAHNIVCKVPPPTLPGVRERFMVEI